jgi:release factor glutamine methyltransferase
MLLSECLQKTAASLSSISATPALEARWLIQHVMGLTDAQVSLPSETRVPLPAQSACSEAVARRLAGEPLALILGTQGFWSLILKVNADTLIPRPETEGLVEWLLSAFDAKTPLRIVDLGTGSGAIALSLATERPLWHIDATDFSAAALAVAKENARTYGLDGVHFLQGAWFAPVSFRAYDVIVSNPPYLANDDPHLPQLSYEPETALVAGPTGLSALYDIIDQAPHYLRPGGCLVLEHGATQGDAVRSRLSSAGFMQIQQHSDLAGLPRFVTGCLAA